MVDRRRSVLSRRDQATSAFSAILMRLLDSTGALTAALVDTEGETVDYAGGDPFETKIAAAELRLVAQLVEQAKKPTMPHITEMVVRARHRSFAMILLTDGYALVLELIPRSFTVSSRAISEAVRELRGEAGLDFADQRQETERWVRVDVRAGQDQRRPEAVWVEGAWSPVVILGHYHLDRREVGYRARLETGAEITLVRERLGRWYADVLPGA